MKSTTIRCHEGELDAIDRTDCEAVTIRFCDDLGRDTEFTLDERGVAELCEWLQGWRWEVT